MRAAHTHRIPRPVLTPRQGSGQAPPGGASLRRRCGRPVVVGFSAVSQMAPLASPSCHKQQSKVLSRSALKARDLLVLEHLPLADAIASAAARRLFPLVEREDLIQVAREALVRSAPRCRSGEPPAPYLRRCITGALQHHLRDRVRLLRIPHRLHEQGQCPLGHLSLDASADGEPCLLDQLPTTSQNTALRLMLQEGLTLRAAAERLEISAMSVHRAQKKPSPACAYTALAGAESPSPRRAGRINTAATTRPFHFMGLQPNTHGPLRNRLLP